MRGTGELTWKRAWRLARAAAAPLLLVVPGAALVGVPAVLLTAAMAAPEAAAQNTAKTIEGKVLDHETTALPGSIVYLQDQKTNVVKTFIATGDGSYRFGQLPADTDYKIWAEYKGEKSKNKLISSFDTKLNVTLDFHIGK